MRHSVAPIRACGGQSGWRYAPYPYNYYKSRMISELATPGDSKQTFVIQPNPPVPWRTLQRMFCGMAGFVMLVGVVCALAGLPLVLPFAGIEVAVLGACLYLSARRGSVREVVDVGATEISLASGHHGPVSRVSFPRHWVKVVLERSREGWYPSRLLLRSHGRQAEVGRFLTEQERLALAARLRAALDGGNFETHFHSNPISAEKCRGLEHEA